MDSQLCEHLICIGQHVDEMRDRRTLIARDVRDARLEQGLGDGEDAFAVEFFAFAKPQLADFLAK
jgi:hypothetical protein